MGNHGSTRRVSFNNDEPDHVVKVSEKVVVELLKQSDGGDRSSQQQNYYNPKSSTHETHRKQSTTLGDDHRAPDLILKNQQNELTEKFESELQKNNDYWEKRINDLQESHERINLAWQAEYQRALDDVDELFGKVPPKGGKTPCSAEKSAVISCYKKNAAQPLLCAGEVQAFSDCMNGARK